MEKCLTASDNSVTAQHPAQPICWKVPSEESAHPHTAETKRLLLLSLPIIESYYRTKTSTLEAPSFQERTPEDKNPGVSGCATEMKGKRKKVIHHFPHSFKIKTLEEMCMLKCFSPLSGRWREKDQVPQSLPSCPKPS